MRRFGGWVCLGLVLVTGAAAAKEEKGYLPVHVCVHPPYLKGDVILWTYYASSTDFIYTLTKDYATKRYPRPTFLYDPDAPPSNTQLLPREEDRKLTCVPRTPPEPPAPQEEAKPKKEAPPKASPAPAREAEKGRTTNAEPGARSAPVEHRKTPEEEEQERRERAWRSQDAVLPHADKDDPRTTVLPYRKVLPEHTNVLPTRRHDDICAWELPPGGKTETERAQTCAGRGKGDGTGVAKTDAEKFAEYLAYSAGLMNLQLDEDLKRPDGKLYGIIGGRNPDGPNSALTQAAASAVMMAAIVLSPGAESFLKKLSSSAAKGTPLLMKDMEKVGLDVAEELATKIGQNADGKAVVEGAEQLVGKGPTTIRFILADTLHKEGAIGPYEVMKQFTDKLGGTYQAHHILEKRWAEELTLGDPAKVPSVILTEAEHKKFTAELRAMASEIEIKDAQTLWNGYKQVYKEHPTWLAAIKPYFGKVK